MARTFHLEGTKNITDAAKEVGAKLVFISTDYVFSDSEYPVTEEETRAPLNAYGQFKKECEDFIQESLTDYIIVRTTNIYGWDPNTMTPNYFMNVYRNLTSGSTVKAPSNLWGTPPS